MPVDILWISKIAPDMFLNFSNDMSRPKRLFHSPVNSVDKNTGPSLHLGSVRCRSDDYSADSDSAARIPLTGNKTKALPFGQSFHCCVHPSVGGCRS
jgi:hypothetical protein